LRPKNDRSGRFEPDAPEETIDAMANTLLSPEEQILTPDEVDLLDKRRRRGQLFLVIIVSVLLSLWTGQDLTYSPGWMHPMAYWNAITLLLALFFGVNGVRLRRGSNEFISY
jgi:hypothetical protein